MTREAENQRNSLMASSATNTAVACVQLKIAIRDLPRGINGNVQISQSFQKRLMACLQNVAKQLDAYAIELERRVE